MLFNQHTQPIPLCTCRTVVFTTASKHLPTTGRRRLPSKYCPRRTPHQAQSYRRELLSNAAGMAENTGPGEKMDPWMRRPPCVRCRKSWRGGVETCAKQVSTDTAYAVRMCYMRRGRQVLPRGVRGSSKRGSRKRAGRVERWTCKPCARRRKPCSG